jgi:hypothetical protein
MLFSWYAGDYTTDAALAEAAPDVRANPSMGSWANASYLDQQRRRLPAHKFRRLHLNLPGAPEGAAFQPGPVIDAIARGVAHRPRATGVEYIAFVDMSGGSSDDAVLAIGHVEGPRIVVDRIVNQGQPAPFDPRAAVSRFATVLAEYGVRRVTGDAYSGLTFVFDFASHQIHYSRCAMSASALYEALEPKLNAGEVSLPDVPLLEQQLLGLAWRGSRITHSAGEHDDHANAVAGLINELMPVNGDRIEVVETCGWGYGLELGYGEDPLISAERERSRECDHVSGW